MSSNIEHRENGNEEEEEQDIQWRRDKVLQLSSQGYSQREIASILKLSVGTINRDLQYLKEQSKENIKKYVDERLPLEYQQCLIGLGAILKESWSMAKSDSESNRDKLQALNLAKECYAMKMDMLTNATVIDDAIRFIAVNTSDNKRKEKAKAHDLDNTLESDIQGPSQNNRSETGTEYTV